MMSLVSKIPNPSPTLDSGASNSPGTRGKQSSRSDRSGTGKPVAKVVNEITALRQQNENTRSGIGKTVAKTINRLSETRMTHHNFSEIQCEPSRESFFECTTQIESPPRGHNSAYRRQHDDLVHLGRDYHENLRTTKNTDSEQVRALFNISQRLKSQKCNQRDSSDRMEHNTMDEIDFAS